MMKDMPQNPLGAFDYIEVFNKWHGNTYVAESLEDFAETNRKFAVDMHQYACPGWKICSWI